MEDFMEELIGKVMKVTTFKEGDLLLHEKNYKFGMRSFFRATEHDVRFYSGKNGFYYKLIM